MAVMRRFDFRARLALVLSLSLAALIWEDPVLQACLAGGVVVLALLSGVPLRPLAVILGLSAPFYLVILLVHGFFNIEQVKYLTGQILLTPLFTLPAGLWIIGGLSLWRESLWYGINVVLKTVSLSLVLPTLFLSVDIDEMLSALLQLRLPPKVVFIFSSGLRFFPVLFQRTRAMLEAQRLRGFELSQSRLDRQVRMLASLAVPLILSSLLEAQQLEIILQSRGFTGVQRRTALHQIRLRLRDWILILLCALFILAAGYFYLTLGVGKFTAFN